MTRHSKRVVLFGELLMRLNPTGFERLVQASSFEIRYTGAEANAGVSLVNYGFEAAVVSKVPDTAVGEACLNYLRSYGLDVEHVARGGDRLGLLYVEQGAAQRPSKVIYDRAGSSFASSDPTDYDWPAILEDADWLHFSGTAPALGSRVVAALETGLGLARERGIQVSCDLNYRTKLWTPENAASVMTPLMPFVDVLIGNEEDAEKVFGMRAEGSDVRSGRLDQHAYADVARQLIERFGVRFVATTLRESVSASHNRWAGMLSDREHTYVSRTYDILPVVDRVGGGDAFSGALIHAFLSGCTPQRAVDLATAASCLKHSIPGDFNLVSLSEVEALAAGDVSGRVQR
jgi:2-dehydro-3-deoxygluconokinase